MFAADVVGGEPVVAELADFFRVRAAEHLDDVLDADAESAFLPNAIDAREKLLRRQRAVPRLARRETIIAAAAIEWFARVGKQGGRLASPRRRSRSNR